MDSMDAELIIRLLIGLFWMYACVYAVHSTKLVYWRQCWYIILTGCVIHTIYLMVMLVSDDLMSAGMFGASVLRNVGMGLVAVGMLLLAKRMKAIMGPA